MKTIALIAFLIPLCLTQPLVVSKSDSNKVLKGQSYGGSSYNSGQSYSSPSYGSAPSYGGSSYGSAPSYGGSSYGGALP